MSDTERLDRIAARWLAESKVARGDVEWLLSMARKGIVPWDGVEIPKEIADILRRSFDG